MIENEVAYERAKRANIKRNKRVGNQRRFFEQVPDAQELSDWLSNSGEFADLRLTKDPADQEAYEKAVSEITDNIEPGIDPYTAYWQELLTLEEAYDVQTKKHPLTKGMFSGKFGDTLMSMHENILEWGGLTEKQAKLVRNALARKRQWVAEDEKRAGARLAEDLKSAWIGEVKERRMFDLSIKKILSFDGFYGRSYLFIMRDAGNNVVIYKGSAYIGEEGATISIKATVKAHDTRKGVKQTIIARPAR